MVSVKVGKRGGWFALGPTVWRVLAHSLMFGLALSVADLIFNFYLVSLGYDVRTAGLLSTVNRAAGMLLGIPIGFLIDRIGSQRSLLIGMVTFSLGWGLLLTSRDLWVLIATQFIIGAAYILASTAAIPLIAAVAPPERRATVFGLNASAIMIIGLLGSVLGGLLPSLAGAALQVDPQSAPAYRIALLSVVALGVLAMIPVLRALPPAPIERPVGDLAPPIAPRVPYRRLVFYAMPSFLLGIGGGMILPFQNLFFRQQFGMTDAAVGVVLAWTALGMGLGALIGAPITARVGLKRGAGWLRFGMVPAMLLVMVPIAPVAVVGMFLRGLFVTASYPMYDAVVMKNTPEQQRGMAISMMSLMWAGGWAFASVISGWIQSEWGFLPVLIIAVVCYAFSALNILLLPVPNETSA